MATDDIKIVVSAEDKASGILSNVGNKVGDLGGALTSLAKVAGVAMIAAAGALATFGVASFKAFAEAEKEMVVANQALTNTVKNLSKDELTKLQIEAGKGKDALGYLKEQMDAVGKSAVKLGFDDEQASVAFAKLFQVSNSTKQAQEDLKLAMDLSAFSGRDLTSSADAITKVHAGATRVLKEFGISVKDGISVEDALKVMHERTADAAASMAKSTAGQLQVLGIEWTNLKEKVGESLAIALVPFISKLNEWITDPRLEQFLTKALANFTNLLNVIADLPRYWDMLTNSSKNLNVVGGSFITQNAVMISIIDALKFAFDLVWKSLSESLIPAFKQLWATLEPMMPALIEFGKLFGKIVGTILLGALLATINAVAGLIAITAEVLAGLIKLTDWLVDTDIKKFDDFTTDLSKVITAFQSIVEWGEKAWNTMQKMTGNVGSAWKNLPGNLGIPGFADGGTVPGPVGSPTLAVVHGGETVIPVGRSMGAGIVINITGTFLSEDAAERLSDILINRLKMDLRI